MNVFRANGCLRRIVNIFRCSFAFRAISWNASPRTWGIRAILRRMRRTAVGLVSETTLKRIEIVKADSAHVLEILWQLRLKRFSLRK
jgi:hypothetical protein